MKVSELYPKKFLCSEDVQPHGDVAVTISKVETERFPARGRMPAATKILLSFAGSQKKLILSSPQAHGVKALHGDDFPGWVGKRVTMYVLEGFQAFGGTHDVIRFRETVPAKRSAGDASALDAEQGYDPNHADGYDGPPDSYGGER